MTKKKLLTAVQQRTAELQHLAKLENEITAMRLDEAKKDLELAQLRRQVQNLEKDRADQERRIMWVRLLVDGGQKTPKDLLGY